MNNQALRKQTIESLAALVDRFPNLRIGQLVGHALGDAHDLMYLPDEDIARSIHQLYISLTQFEAAGILKRPELETRT